MTQRITNKNKLNDGNESLINNDNKNNACTITGREEGREGGRKGRGRKEGKEEEGKKEGERHSAPRPVSPPK